MLMHRPQTPQPGFGSITLLQKFTPHFKILDPRLDWFTSHQSHNCLYYNGILEFLRKHYMLKVT